MFKIFKSCSNNIIKYFLRPVRFPILRFDVQYNNIIFIPTGQIYHLAIPDIRTVGNPVKTFRTLTVGSTNLLGLAKRIGARILIGSSSDVYGTTDDKEPVAETYFGKVDPIGENIIVPENVVEE